MRLTWSCPVCGTVNQDYHRSVPLGTVGIQVGLRLLGTIEGIRGAAAQCRRLQQVDDGRVPIVPFRTTRGEVITTVAVAPSARGVVEAVVVAVLQGSRLSERLSGITSRRGAKGCGSSEVVEDAVSAKTEEQDRLKALDASIANLEKAHGGKPDVAIDELKEMQSCKSEVDCDGFLLRATVTSAVDAWTCGVESSSRSGTTASTSRPGHRWTLIRKFWARGLQRRYSKRSLVDTFPSQRAAPYAAGFQMSKSQERPLPDAEVQVGSVAGVSACNGRFSGAGL